MKVFLLVSAFFLASCGSSVDKIADAIADSNTTPTPAPGAVTAPGTQATALPVVSTSNAELELGILGKWDLYSRGCEGEQFSWEFSAGGACYIVKTYAGRYKCTWQWIGVAQMKVCVGQECRTDARISLDKNTSMMTITSDRCVTEYRRPELK
jgi:hypothetical protein